MTEPDYRAKAAQNRAEAADLSLDGLIGHRVQIYQPKLSYRAGSDAVFLAAAIAPSHRRGVGRDHPEQILDVGCGVGAVSICLAWRWPEIDIHGLELQSEMAALCQRNVALNKFSDRLSIWQGDISAVPAPIRNRRYDQVVSNPPFYQPGRSRPAANESKDLAHRELTLGLQGWLHACLKRLQDGGELTLIQTADRLPDILSGLEGRAGDVRIFPLWPKANAAAHRVIVKARKGRKGPPKLLSGLIVHDDTGAQTPEAREVLQNGGAFILEP